ncbi:Uncharacterized membrane protein YphA, DoxX/SURF4 family [Flavobacterium frigidimaris]|nr:Uncharacterized membrane protein YphA, DoxX/SURF4 family [Flavobacterium frigidimaris]
MIMKFQVNFKSVFTEVVCLLYILLFVYASISKLLDFENFQVQLGQSPLLSAFASWISWLVPLTELMIVILLIIHKLRKIGLFACICIMTMFTAYIFIVLHFSSFVPCSCGGILEDMSWNVHLVFNIVFVLLGVSALLLKNNINMGRKFFCPPSEEIKAILISMTCSILVIVLLFLSSEQIMQHENPFIRRYPQHPILLQKTIDLKFNSYYFAGYDGHRIYLGNYTDPLHIESFDRNFNNKKVFKIFLEPKEIPFKRVQILVRGSYFYLIDGTAPCIFRGKTSDWKITKELKGIPYFSEGEPIDSSTVVFRSNSGRKASHILGIYKFDKSPKITYNNTLLRQQIDGVFDTDGMLIYSQKLKQMIYVHYYRNEFIVADNNLKVSYRGHTIDTISHAKIKVAYLKDSTERKMAAPPLIVNAHIAESHNLLFVHSKIPGRFEDKKLWQQAFIIDVYNLEKNSYLLSFAIYGIKDKKLRSFIVTSTHLYALIDDKVSVYSLEARIKKEMSVIK